MCFYIDWNTSRTWSFVLVTRKTLYFNIRNCKMNVNVVPAVPLPVNTFPNLRRRALLILGIGYLLAFLVVVILEVSFSKIMLSTKVLKLQILTRAFTSLPEQDTGRVYFTLSMESSDA